MEYMESKMQDIYDGQFEQEMEIAEAINKGFINENMEPIKCSECGHKEFTETVKSIDGGHVSEKQSDCAKCGQLAGYWAYGNWQV